MGTAIHPDGPGLLIRADVLLDRDNLLRLGIFFGPNTKVEWASIDIRRDVHLALMLGQRKARRVPTLGPEAGAVSDGKTRVVDQFGAGNALGLVFHEDR